MSIKVMSRVWEHSHQKGSALLALLALADWSHDDGSSWYGLKKIYPKMRMSESETRRILHALTSTNELHIEYGKSDVGTNLYFVTTAMTAAELAATFRERLKLPLDDCLELSGQVLGRGVKMTGVAKKQGGVSASRGGGVIAMTPDPLYDPLLDTFSEPMVQGETPILQMPDQRSPFSTTYTHESPNAKPKGKSKRIMGRESVVEGYEPNAVKVNPLNKPSAAPGRPAVVPKPAKPRNLVFDKVGLVCFGLTEDKANSAASMIGQFKKALTAYLGETMINDNPVGVIDLLGRWDEWYIASHKPGWSKPKSAGKFIDSFNEGMQCNFGIGQATADEPQYAEHAPDHVPDYYNMDNEDQSQESRL